MKILVLGAGAIGGYFGGRLVEAGADVTFLVREKRREILKKNGLRIESPAFGDYHAAEVQTVTTTELPDAGTFDIVLLTCKAYDLDTAMDAIAPAVQTGAMVLPLLNGLAHMAILNEKFGDGKVMGGLAKIAATVAEDGTIKHLNDWRFLTFGAQDGSDCQIADNLKALFDRTSVIANVVPDIMPRMWEKFVHLGTVASMTCLMRASIGEIARTPYGSDMLKEAFEEMATLAAHNGVDISDDFRAEYYTLFENKDSPYTASMLRDLEHGRPIEGEHIVGFALKSAQNAGLACPLLRTAYTHLMAYGERGGR